MATPTQRKRPRQEFESSNDDITNIHQKEYSPNHKKQRLQNNLSNQSNHKEVNIHSIAISDCKVTFTATQPVYGNTAWEATLNHCCYQKDKTSTLVKASFSVINIQKLSNHDKTPGLSDVIDHDKFFHDILYLEKVDVIDVFRGFDYELCLVQRIIDNHARTVDVVVIKYHVSLQYICKNMDFSRMKQSVYWSRNESHQHPVLQDFCVCFQKNGTKQQITETIFANQYIDEDAKSDNTDSKSTDNSDAKSENIDMNSCFVTFSSQQNATNDVLEEDFTSLWSAKLKYRSEQKIVTLATSTFWFINLPRLLNYGEYDNIFTVFDAPCQELCDLFQSVISTSWFVGPFRSHENDRINHVRVRGKGKIDPKNGLTLEILVKMMASVWPSDEMNEGGGGNIVYLNRVSVNKGYNGYGYGRCLAQKIIDNFGRGFDGIVLKPFPLQWETTSNSNPNHQKKSFEEDMKKVIDVWETMWFYQFGGPNSKYWGRSEAWKHPKIEEFCKCFQSTT